MCEEPDEFVHAERKHTHTHTESLASTPESLKALIAERQTYIKGMRHRWVNIVANSQEGRGKWRNRNRKSHIWTLEYRDVAKIRHTSFCFPHPTFTRADLKASPLGTNSYLYVNVSFTQAICFHMNLQYWETECHFFWVYNPWLIIKPLKSMMWGRHGNRQYAPFMCEHVCK